MLVTQDFFTYKVGSFATAESMESSTFRELTTVHEVWTDESTFAEFAG